MKKNMKLIVLILSAITLCLLGYFFLFPKGIQVTIHNQTEQYLYNLSIEIFSYNSSDFLSIEPINPGETNSIAIELPTNFDEGRISLCYYDQSNTCHKETILGYVEQNYNINIQLSIDSIDSDGNLKISIH